MLLEAVFDHFRAVRNRAQVGVHLADLGLEGGKRRRWDPPLAPVEPVRAGESPRLAPAANGARPPSKRFATSTTVQSAGVAVGRIREDVWPTVLAEGGIERVIDDEGSWQLWRGEALGTFNNVEVAKLTAGVIFSGISPIAVTETVDAALDHALHVLS